MAWKCQTSRLEKEEAIPHGRWHKGEGGKRDGPPPNIFGSGALFPKNSWQQTSGIQADDEITKINADPAFVS